MGFFSLFSHLSPVHINMVTLFTRAKCVGQDPYGNKYYQAPARNGYNHPRRWVRYKNTPEASSVPAEWHGWLHHQTDDFPSQDEKSFRRKWQKPHKSNMTGTTESYRPKGHVLAGGKRDKATGDYEAWNPNE
ncbi:MAG: NADH:ubiquinone oxidoreductase subunit NDUFA12 [Bdellovibrionales bacterium]